MRTMPLQVFNMINGRYYSRSYNVTIVEEISLPKESKVLLILKERGTDELFKCFIDDTLREYIRIRNSNLYINGSESPKGIFAKEYMQNNFDLDSLTNVAKSNLKEFIMDKLKYNAISVRGEKMKDIILNKILDDDFPEYENEFANFIYGLYANSDAIKVLEKYKDQFNVRFNLLRKDNRFTGKYKMYTDRYNGNTNKKSFDTFTIEINMFSDYDKNLKYLKENAKDVRFILKSIIESDALSKDYANYLKLYHLVLSRENILVARFCFKEGLEGLCK